MKILYIAWGSSMYSGGEYKIGWAIPYEVAKNNDVFVITRGIFAAEHKKNKNMISDRNIRFFYVDPEPIHERLFRGQLEPMILNFWLKKIQNIAIKICKEENIDIIHQITPIEFRSIGNFGQIANVKFVVGPLGGAEYMPKQLESYIPSIKIRFFELGRRISNYYHRSRLLNDSKNVDCAFFSNEETLDYLKKVRFPKTALTNDTGIDRNQISDYCFREGNKVVFLTAGRLIYRKGHLLLLDAIERINDHSSFKVLIAGDGAMEHVLKEAVKKKRLEDCVFFLGRVPYEKMHSIYQTSHVFVMPSLRETGGSVILESLSNGMPIIAPNAYGGKKVIDHSIGRLYDISGSREEIIESLKDTISYFIDNKEEIPKMGIKCIEKVEEYVWEKKCREYTTMYSEILNL